MADAEITFSADFAEAHRDIDEFYRSLSDGAREVSTEIEDALSPDVSDSLAELEEIEAWWERMPQVVQFTRQGFLSMQGAAASLGITFTTVAVAAAALAVAIGSVVIAIQVIQLAFRVASAAVSFFVDSLKLAMEAEDEAYEKAVKLAEANGQIPPPNDTLSESFRRISETITEAHAAVGTAFIPVIKELVPIAQVLADVVKELAEGFAEWSSSLVDEGNFSVIEAFLITFIAHVVAFLESLKGVQLQMEKLKWEWDNMFTFTWDADATRKKFDEEQAIAHGFVDEKGNADIKGLRSARDSVGVADPNRVKEIEEDLKGRLLGEKNKPALNNDIVNFQNQVLRTLGASAKPGQGFSETVLMRLPEMLGEGIVSGAGEAAKLWDDELKPVFREGAEWYSEAMLTTSNAQASEISKVAAGIRASVENSGQKGFQSGLEEITATSKRFLTSSYSTEDIPKRQLTALEQQIVQADDQAKREIESQKTLNELLEAYKNGKTVATAG